MYATIGSIFAQSAFLYIYTILEQPCNAAMDQNIYMYYENYIPQAEHYYPLRIRQGKSDYTISLYFAPL